MVKADTKPVDGHRLAVEPLRSGTDRSVGHSGRVKRVEPVRPVPLGEALLQTRPDLLVECRVHDVGGQTGFGPVPEIPGSQDSPPFHADWEARVYALAGVLGRRGLFSGDELRDTIESLPPERYLSASYYERWLEALEILVARKGVA